MKLREPAVAGQFYSSDASELSKELEKSFAKAQKPSEYSNIRAIIAPHAGYVFSGDVAAVAYSQIDPDTVFDNVFVIAPSHHYSFNGASVYIDGDYKTPLGLLNVNVELGKTLIDENLNFSSYNQAHMNEHSLEVQLPFLQYHIKPHFQLVPIIIGSRDEKILKSLAETLKPFFTKENLFVISSDFSHFPEYNQAQKIDQNTADAIVENKPEHLLKAIKKNGKAGVNGLATSACGLSGILTLLYITQNKKTYVYHKLRYENSGDKKFGDKMRVVGYWALSVEDKETNGNFSFGDHEKTKLLEIARKTIKNKIELGQPYKISENDLPDLLKQKCGVFVTIHKSSELRGCIGRFLSEKPLYALTQEMAKSAALHDSRFLPISTNEVDDLNIEISVLTPLKKIKSVDEIEIGKHGIYIKQGFNHGTLLPQVALKKGWTAEEFLGYCAKHKAGIGWDGWKQADVFTFEAIVFGE